MGTRGWYGFVINKKKKLTYNHYDSYPSGLGADIVNFINDHPEQLRVIAEKIVMIDPNTKPTADQIEECLPWYNETVSNQCVDDWYCLLHKSQGKLECFTQGLKYMLDNSDCGDEYGYIINLDTNEFEVYFGDTLKRTFELSKVTVDHMKQLEGLEEEEEEESSYDNSNNQDYEYDEDSDK